MFKSSVSQLCYSSIPLQMDDDGFNNSCAGRRNLRLCYFSLVFCSYCISEERYSWDGTICELTYTFVIQFTNKMYFNLQNSKKVCQNYVIGIIIYQYNVHRDRVIGSHFFKLGHKLYPPDVTLEKVIVANGMVVL